MSTPLIEEAEALADLFERNEWVGHGRRCVAALRDLAAALKAAEERERGLREMMRKARDHTTPTGGSFRQWHGEIVKILDDAINPPAALAKAGGE